ncbi:MAG: DUF2470 domain-containing protein [Acidiferrobacterales bacterium]
MSDDTQQSEAYRLSEEERAAIVEHMNQDHTDALLLYAQVFGGAPTASAATMTSIDSNGMDLEVTSGEAVKLIRIEFDHRLRNPGDARRTLVEMAKSAREADDHGA